MQNKYEIYQQHVLPLQDKIFFQASLLDKNTYPIPNEIQLTKNTMRLLGKIDQEIKNFDFENIDFAHDKQVKISQIYTYHMYILIRLITKNPKSINEQLILYYIRLLGIQTFLCTFFTNKLTTINNYQNLSNSLIDYLQIHEETLTDDYYHNYYFLKRAVYLTNHKIFFVPNEYAFTRYYQFMLDDIKYSKKKSVREQLISIKNYLNISLDYITQQKNKQASLVKLDELNSYFKQIDPIVKQYLHKNTPDESLLFHVFSTFFKRELIYVDKQLAIGKKIGMNFRCYLLQLCIQLIKILYRDQDFSIFYQTDKTDDAGKYQEILKNFSGQLVKLLNETKRNATDPLFMVFRFLSLFKEYQKLNQNIYKKLTNLTKLYNNRMINLMAGTLYLKSMGNLELLNNEIIKIKKSIESRPLLSLINLYNSEIDSLYTLDEEKKLDIKIDPFINDIIEYITLIKEKVNQKINNYLNKPQDDNHYATRSVYIQYFKKQYNNYLLFAEDPNLLRQLNKFYTQVLDTFVKEKKMTFREDFQKKINVIKTAILDINPLFLAITLAICKLNHLIYLLQHEHPDKFMMQADLLSDEHINKIVAEKKAVNEFLNIKDEKIDKDIITRTLLMKDDSAIVLNKVAPAESRVLRTILYFILKMQNLTSIHDNFFPEIYEFAINTARKVWELDPIIVYYFNHYLVKRNNFEFYNRKEDKNVKFKFQIYINPKIYEEFHRYIEVLLDSTELEEDLINELEEISQFDKVNLLNENGERQQNITDSLVNEYVTKNKTIYLEKPIITDDQDLIYVISIIELFLINIGRYKLINPVTHIINELVKNANQANLKRAHFKAKGMEIEHRYNIGIGDFTKMLEEKYEDYVEIVHDLNLKVCVQFQVLNNNLIISVINNYKIHANESKNINERFKIGFEINDLKEARSQNLKTPEGKGLGLIIIIFLMRQLGLDQNSLHLDVKENKSIFKIVFPVTKIREKEGHKIANILAKEVDKIPILPESIVKLQQTVNNPQADLNKIELMVQKNTSLAGNVIKMANSPVYLRANKTKNLKEAIQLIGLKGLNNLIMVHASFSSIKNKNNIARIKKIIAHSERVAYFSKRLVEILNLKVHIDDIYLPALLHDIGIIIVEGVHKGIYNEIREITATKHIPIPVIEDLMGGFHHNLVGYLMAKKWNFPDLTCQIIRNHHNPRDMEKNFDETFVVYLANELTHFCDKNIIIENLDKNVLEYFSLDDPEELVQVSNQINEDFNQYSESTAHISI